MVPRYTKSAAWLVAMLALLQPSPLLAQDAAAAPTARPATRSMAASAQRRLQPIVNGRRAQPRRQEMCATLRRGSDCRDRADAADDDLLRDILRRSAR